MKRSSHILSALLVVLVAFTAQSAALARTMPDAAGHMVLCTGTGPVMVYFDENGEPTAPPQLCPEFALSLIVALAIDEVAFDALGGWQAQTSNAVVTRRSVLRLGAPNARAPPVFV